MLLSTVIAQRISDDSWMEDSEPFDPNALSCCFVVLLVGYGIVALVKQVKSRLVGTSPAASPTAGSQGTPSNPRQVTIAPKAKSVVEGSSSPVMRQSATKVKTPTKVAGKQKARSAKSIDAVPLDEGSANPARDPRPSKRGSRETLPKQEPKGKSKGGKGATPKAGKKSKPEPPSKPTNSSRSSRSSVPKSQPARKPSRPKNRKRIDP